MAGTLLKNTMKAIGNNIIVEIEKDLFKEENGIIVHLSDRPINKGKIVAIGPNCNYNLTIGSEVQFSEYKGNEFLLNDKWYINIKESDIYVEY
jgi:co-chaperonin GroES (HSP10)